MNLGEYLLQAYGHTGLQSAAVPKNPQRIRIDDRYKERCDPAGEFCEIEVIIHSPESMEFELRLSHIPYDCDVEELADELGGRWEGCHPYRTLTLSMHIRSTKDIRRLGTVVKGVRGRGKRYEVPNWWWITRRAANSLKEFARTLDSYRRKYAPNWRPEEVVRVPKDEWQDEWDDEPEV